MAGLLTDKCIDPAIKDGADRGYRMTCLHDPCMAVNPEQHEEVLACSQGYCDQTTVAVLPLILPCAHPSCG